MEAWLFIILRKCFFTQLICKMAPGNIRISVLLLITVVILFAIVDVECRRGGGRSSGGSRSWGRSKPSRSWGRSKPKAPKIRSYRNVVLSGRIVKGSSPFKTSSAFQRALAVGTIYGSVTYLSRYRRVRKVPPICTNTKARDTAGRVYGYFICPREFEPVDHIYCCGGEKREYCCNKAAAQRYYGTHRHGKSGKVSVGVIIGIIVAIVVVLVVAVYCCKKRKQAGEVMRKFSSRGGRAKGSKADGPQAVPLNDPVKQRDDPACRPPPPSYHASTTGYDSSSGIPYGPPQPQPDFDDDKSGLPPPGIGTGAPYPPPSTPGGAPYPTADGPPYPAPGVAPYPMAGGTPYPPAGDAPYPPTSDVPYPPAGDAPYPPTSDVPYPPAGNVPYPPAGDAPYPIGDTAPYPPTGAPYPSPTAPPPNASAPPYPGNPASGAAYDSSMTYPPYPPASQSSA